MKILSFTSIRSDYDLLFDLYKLLDDDSDVDFRLFVSGAHLSSSYGKSIDNIKQDGFNILAEVETLIDGDSVSSRVKSASIFFQNSIDIVNFFQPDLILFVGDREDAIVIPIIASYLKIPTIHFYGGDHVTDGNVDNPIRHAASKLASVHFVTLPEHKSRLIRMGEEESRIHVIGNISLDKIVSFNPISVSELGKHFRIVSFPTNFAVLIFHPILSDLENSINDFRSILEALNKLEITVFCGYPNTDSGNRQIIDEIERNRERPRFIAYKNLSRELFLTLFYYSSFVIGNSSSGILEAASLKKPVINVGLRQMGRYADGNVQFCEGNVDSVISAINLATSDSYRSHIANVKNSYGDGKSANKAYNLIKSIKFNDLVYKTFDPLK
ncbi:UDP-N-acetylglucosamine 2-epimerase [Cognataquiflexum aquatile]|uniref:UDP-N-acetylglucosamine 2-epimerase n=1 Tax=Cognataquiflexum aquatile TaxID=2249427 RepID=UPI000DEB9E72|nr:UDP-N-acetylglucosamine 2-epimerase [Cognataquiflexum aquatile]